MKRIKVGIIGCGVIGSEIAKACRLKLRSRLELAGVCDIDRARVENLKGILGGNVRILKLDDLIKRVDLVVEAASASISAEVIKKCIKNKRDVMVMSVGGVIGKERLLKEAEVKGIMVYLPSGALCGIDGLKGACKGRIDSVTLTTRKPPKGLEGAPYLADKGLDLSSMKDETIVFEGSAAEAVQGFPQNVNVSAVLSLAGIGAQDTRVKIVTSPAYTNNTHEVEIAGEFGRITTKTENVPSKPNPKTSAMAVFSAIATLEGITRSVRIGT